MKDIECGKSPIAAVCREFSVSDVSVCNWLHKYSSYLQKGVGSGKTERDVSAKERERELSEVQAALGKKQLQTRFLEMIIEFLFSANPACSLRSAIAATQAKLVIRYYP